MSAFDQIIELIKESCKHGEAVVEGSASPKGVKIPKDDLLPVSQKLLENPLTYFDMLSCITGVDNGAEAGTMEVIYNLYSIPFNHQLMIKVILDREKPHIESVSHIWKTADWHEREIFDMYGVNFLHHPDLRRILMPADWEGYPLRKDYKQQQYYRDIKVEY
ncbi:MAG: NADH-quinone oxidoreductase subunit C [Marivirga sp.]|nr:NADH-quinone oxidoreductase subunit C [Marivirga sp.]